MIRFGLVFSLLFAHFATGADSNDLTPIMASPGEVHLQMNFDNDFVIKRGDKFFALGQGTQWEAKDGQLVGTQSKPEYQAKKKAEGNGHLGTAPRLQFPGSPKDVILKYSFKIVGGKGTKLLPIIEAGHHLRRVYFGPDGSEILVDHEKVSVAKNDFVLKSDKWYHVMVEIKGDEFLLRFQDGPSLYGNHPGVGAEFENYNIGITATDKGTMYIDNMTIWHAGAIQADWEDNRSKLFPNHN